MCCVYITCSDKNKRSFDICKSKKRQKKTKRNKILFLRVEFCLYFCCHRHFDIDPYVILPVIEEISVARSLSSRGFWVKLRYSSLSSSSEIVTGLLLCFSCSLHSKFPFLQSIIGFVSRSQGSPRMILCFPSPVTSNRSFWVRPWISIFKST